jgi:hypothetical protein
MQTIFFALAAVMFTASAIITTKRSGQWDLIGFGLAALCLAFLAIEGVF